MRVDGKRAEHPQGGAFGVRRVHDFSSLPQELFIAEGDEFRWICHASRRIGTSSNGWPQGRNANRGPFGSPESAGVYKPVPWKCARTNESGQAAESGDEKLDDPSASYRLAAREGSVGEVDVFRRGGETATAPDQVFTRRASGLVRVMSPYSACAYNILNIGMIFPWVYITPLALDPGASIWTGILICGAFTSLLAVVYAGLASAMPRTGGDYVFQSRTLRPWFGFATVAMMIITFFLQWQALGGWLVSVLGVYPLLTGLGVMTGNHTLVDWGAWYLVGWGPTIVTMVSSTIAALVLIKSFRWFVQLQWVMWYGFLLSYVLMVVLFLTTSNSAFAQRYDTASAFVAGGSGAYQAILNNAITNGFTPARTVSILVQLSRHHADGQPDPLVPHDHRDHAQCHPGRLQRDRWMDPGCGRYVDRRRASQVREPRQPADPHPGLCARDLPHPRRVRLRLCVQPRPQLPGLHVGGHRRRHRDVHRYGPRRRGFPMDAEGGLSDGAHLQVQSRADSPDYDLWGHRGRVQRDDALLLPDGAVPRERRSLEPRLFRESVPLRRCGHLLRLGGLLLRAPRIPASNRGRPRPRIQRDPSDLGRFERRSGSGPRNDRVQPVVNW